MADSALIPPRLLSALAPLELDGLDDDDTIEACEVSGSLAGASADGATFERCRLVGVHLAGAQLSRLRLRDCVLERCDLSGADLEQSSWQRVELLDCRLSGTMLTNSSWRHVLVARCQANGLAWRMATGQHVGFDETLLRDADWYGTQLADASVTGCDLTGLELSQVKLSDVRFRSCDLTDIRGVQSLGGATIDPGSIMPLALSLFAAIGITVED